MKNFFLTLFGGPDKQVQVVDLTQYACFGFMVYRMFQWSQIDDMFDIEPVFFITEMALYAVVAFGKDTLILVLKAFANLISGRFGKNGNGKKEQK